MQQSSIAGSSRSSSVSISLNPYLRNVFAYLRENQVTKEVRYFDGYGHVWRFLPPDGKEPPPRYEEDIAGAYQLPEGLFLRLGKLSGDAGTGSFVERLARLNVVSQVYTATTQAGQGSAGYNSTTTRATYQVDHLPENRIDGLGRSSDLPVPGVEKGADLNFRTEGVTGRFDLLYSVSHGRIVDMLEVPSDQVVQAARDGRGDVE